MVRLVDFGKIAFSAYDNVLFGDFQELHGFAWLGRESFYFWKFAIPRILEVEYIKTMI